MNDSQINKKNRRTTTLVLIWFDLCEMWAKDVKSKTNGEKRKRLAPHQNTHTKTGKI